MGRKHMLLFHFLFAFICRASMIDIYIFLVFSTACFTYCRQMEVFNFSPDIEPILRFQAPLTTTVYFRGSAACRSRQVFCLRDKVSALLYID